MEVSLHLEFLVEEYSAQVALENLLPKIIGDDAVFRIHPFRGKHDLRKKLPNRLKGYKATPYDWRIIILIDEDREDCLLLKSKLELMAKETGFVTKSSVQGGENFQVLNRIVVEELEAWFLGDISAIREAYPKVSRSLMNRPNYNNPDTISGGTAEALEKILKKAGYHLGGLSKVEAARRISQYMKPEINKSRSFQIFCDGLRNIKSNCL